MRETSGVSVTLDRPEYANLLALLMHNLLERAVAEPAAQDRARRLSGDIQVDAGGMTVTLRFTGDGVVVLSEAAAKPRARVRGQMDALLGMVTGGGVVGPVLTGRVRIGGNPFVLLKMLPLIRP